MELLPPDDAEVAALDREEANIKAAEQGYRSDPALSADFQETGWFEARTQAAKEGRAIPSDGQRQAEPMLRLPAQQGQVTFKPTVWAGFVDLLADVNRRRVALLEAKRPEILAGIAERERQLRGRVLQTAVGDLGPLVGQANELLQLAVAARGPIPRTIRTPGGLAPARYREATHALELADAALAGWSLLDAVPPDEPTTLITSSLGIQPDTAPSPTVEQVRQAAARRYGTTRSG